MDNIYLIGENDLKQYTVINDNVEAAYINPAIIKAQDIGLQPLIGTALYKRLLQMVNDGTIAAEGNEHYKELLDVYVTPYLRERTAVELVWNLFAKLRNAGVVTSNDQQTQQMSIGDCEYLRKKYDYDATFYANRMSDYLRANCSNFPEYTACGNCDELHANRKAYNTGIVL